MLRAFRACCDTSFFQKEMLHYGYYCLISLTSHVKSPSEESVEKVPDHKKASKPAKSKLEPKETPIPLAEAGSVFVKVFW